MGLENNATMTSTAKVAAFVFWLIETELLGGVLPADQPVGSRVLHRARRALRVRFRPGDDQQQGPRLPVQLLYPGEKKA